jgi:hypothetical protein
MILVGEHDTLRSPRWSGFRQFHAESEASRALHARVEMFPSISRTAEEGTPSRFSTRTL